MPGRRAEEVVLPRLDFSGLIVGALLKRFPVHQVHLLAFPGSLKFQVTFSANR